MRCNLETVGEVSKQNNAAQDSQHRVQNREATITMRRSRFIILITISVVIILILLGAVVITASKVVELNSLLNPGLTETQKEFPSLSRRGGVVPDQVWHWIVSAKVKMVFNPKSAHALLRVSNDGKRLHQAFLSSPPRVPTAETYRRCICVSSKALLSTRVYFELQVTQTVPWTVGFRTASFDADHIPDFFSEFGIWTIASADGKIVINDGKPTPTLYVTPTRVGLYLDYKHGQISFYDAVTKFHLYTYLVSFKEKLLFYAAVDVRAEETHGAFIIFS
ncbi:butyrophilin subfamily 3 member A1 isoform X2 [Astyanax mexicanus]|uniref:Butyrophilin subfamily 3 member A1-like n=1 Tax=Astyanax mexicanus TaxID=7994 RepID=A0A8B9JMA7_ASTMX|nr:butyrophilin subfamily 3 member A1 isoform X2 [Astyanax mexicanus]